MSNVDRIVTWGVAAVLLGASIQTSTSVAQAPTAQQQAAQQRVAALKQSMAASQQSLRKYEWVETTVSSHKGEEKSRVEKRVYYGADGKLVKTPLSAPAASKDKRGVRGRVAENVKDDISDYMGKAAARIHEYVPPKPELIQKAVDAGRMTFTETEPGKTGRIEFKDYLYAGDVLAIEMDLATNHMRALNVSTYIDNPKDAVTLKVKMADLTDGTTYSEQSTLVAAAKSITVVVGNAGYKPLSP